MENFHAKAKRKAPSRQRNSLEPRMATAISRDDRGENDGTWKPV
jgi:hypothetical protein